MVVPLATSMVTVLQVVRVGRRCWRFPVWVVWSVGVWKVWCGANGGVLGDGVVNAAGGEVVVGDVVGGRWRVVVVVVAGLLGGLWCRRAALMLGPGCVVAGGRAWWW